MATVHILIIEDYEAWRRFVSLKLDHNPRFQIIGEVSDGLEAVQRAKELQPDLIVLDIGLANLNGIEAARQIRQVAPKSKILFLTENYSPEIVAEALSTGASGYVVKTDAESELLVAVDAVLRGERFVGGRFAGHDFTGAADAKNPSVPQ